MSNRVSRRPGRVSLTSRIALVLGVLALVAGPAAPQVGAAGNLTITTPYPEIVAEPGSSATFKLTLTSGSPTSVSLKATGAPNGWANRFRGGGSVIGSVYVANDKPANAPDVQFSADVPSDAAANEYPITLTATGDNGETATLVVKVKVESAAGGTISLTADFPQQAGPSSQTFSFSLTLKNDTPTAGTFTWNAKSPAPGWTVTAKPSASSTASTLQVDAGSSATLSVTVTPDPNAAAGTVPIVVTVAGGGKTAEADLQVTITGSYALSVSTPDQVLSTTANAGTEKDFQIVATNTGTAPVTQVQATATAPTGWTVTFDPAKVEAIPSGSANNTQTFTAKITPSKDAIAGDYVVTMKVTGAEANGSVDIRVRVETPQFWWIAGVVLLLATFVGLYWVFRTYGRR